MEWLKAVAMLIGRILMVLIFLKSGLGKIEIFRAQHCSWPRPECPTPPFSFWEPFSSSWPEHYGRPGFLTRVGALMLLIFLVPTTLIFHGNFSDQGQVIHFMKTSACLADACFCLERGRAGLASTTSLAGGRGGDERPEMGDLVEGVPVSLYLASFMPAILGAMIAWTTERQFHPAYFILVMTASS